MNNLLKLVVFIIAVALCVLISRCFTPSTPNDIVSSITYINSTLKTINKEKANLIERAKLGFYEEGKLNLLDYKYIKISSFLEGGYKLSVPCDEYCEFLRANENNAGYFTPLYGTTEETKACFEEYYLSANILYNQIKTAMIAYMNKQSITKQEYKDIEKKVKSKNQEIIDEVDKVMNLTSIPETKACTDEMCKKSKTSSNEKDPIYKKIGISKECYDACKMYIDAEGYLPENYGGCSADENKKIQEYAKDHPDMFE